jgi:hypothetical protein
MGSKPAHGEHCTPEPASLVLQNAFAGLEIEDVNTTTEQTSSDPQNFEPEVEEKLPKVVQVVIEKDKAEMEIDFFFAIECFLYNLHDVREQIRTYWSSYKTTGYDLIVATTMTNTAIGRCLPNPYRKVVSLGISSIAV